MSEKQYRAFVDPELPWDGGFPYRVLERFGIAPDSPADAVQDVSFEMSAADLADANVNLAWEQLRVPRRRLVVDFFCYELPPEAPQAEQAGEHSADYPLPWAFVRRLAQTAPPHGEPPRAHRVAMPPALGGEPPLWEADPALHTQEGEPPDER